MLKKLLSITLVVIMLLTMAVGCAQNGEQPPAEPEYLIWNMGQDPKTWDPTLNSASDGGHLINNMFEGLMNETSEGLVEGVADRYEISDDGLVYTFYLKDNAKWSDGQPVTANDFVFAWKRACDPAVAAEYSFIFTPYIKGGNAFFNGEGSRDDVAVVALDDKTLQVELNFPVPYFLAMTAFFAYQPVRQDIVEAHGEGWEKNVETCISNGPFKLGEYQSGSHVLMVKNENYWNADAVKLDGVKALMIEEQTTALNGYQAGEIAVMDDPPNEEIPRLMAEDPNFKVAPRVGTYYYMFNVDAEPFNDVRVRKAFALAIDRKNIVEQVTKAGEIPAVAFIPPALSYSTGESARPFVDGKPVEEYGLDPYSAKVDEAKALLAEAGFPNGEGFPEFTFIYNTSENHKKVAEAVQEMWKTNLGVNVSITNEDWAVFQDTRREGNYLVARGGWLGDYDDPMTMLDLYTSYSGNNDLQWRWQEYAGAPWDTVLNPSNKPFDEAIQNAMTTTGTERDGWIKKAEDTMMNEMVIAPIYFYAYKDIIDSAVVEGVKRTAMGHWIFYDAQLVK